MKLSRLCFFIFLGIIIVSAQALAKQNWGQLPYASIKPGSFSVLIVIEDKIEERKHYLRFVSIHQDKVAVHMAKEIEVVLHNGKTRQASWIKDPSLQSGSHTEFKDLGEKVLISQGELIEWKDGGKELVIKLPFADKTITYYCQRVYLGDKKKNDSYDEHSLLRR